ncbi:MAG: DMT family transporter [Puniceicoccaceae bacterium]|nr:DMT family transporter [Puniceicoccaceae bacterium]MBL6913489.1 DMT family transporter [Puniceicoccaceae bacterium]
MDLAYSLPALAALGYAVAAVCSKCALMAGFGVLRLAFLINLAFVPVFGLLLWVPSGGPNGIQWFAPVLTGAAFFVGQVFTFAAIRMGDVSVQTPVMGAKAVFVVILAVFLGTELVTMKLVIAAVVSMCAVALLGFTGGKSDRIFLTIGLSLVSAFFFACSDVMVAAWGKSFGSGRFLFLAMTVNALLSFALIPFFRGSVRTISPKAWRWGILAAVLMACQALLLNYGLSTYQNVASANVIYSTRGLWSVLLGLLPFVLLGKRSEVVSSSVRRMRFVGALLMCVAIGVLFLN